MTYNKVVDVDGHIMEPPDLWENYLEDRYKDRAIRIRHNEEGLEYIDLAGRRLRTIPSGILGAMAGIDLEDRSQLLIPGKYTYLDACPPASYDPHERIKLMDEEGIDVAVLYPTIGICWEGAAGLDDDPEMGPPLAAAYCRAYNNWLLDFCKPYPDRLIPVAHISILDVEEAVNEMRRTAKLGARGFFVRSDLVNGRNLAHPNFDPIWAEAQDMGLPVTPHTVAHEKMPLDEWYDSLNWNPGGGFLNPEGHHFFQTYLMLSVQLAFTAVMTAGVFERFPRLKYLVLESGAGWVPHWLERLDSKLEMCGEFSPLKEKPSTYFQRQCWVAADPDEKSLPLMAQLLGEDKLLWASDFPHIDAHYGPVRELRENINTLSEDAQRKILGENASRVYGLPV